MTISIQELLDKEAYLKNTGNFGTELENILEQIRENRPEAPVCFGQDDCSIDRLIKCPWRMDCYDKDE